MTVLELLISAVLFTISVEYQIPDVSTHFLSFSELPGISPLNVISIHVVWYDDDDNAWITHDL